VRFADIRDQITDIRKQAGRDRRTAIGNPDQKALPSPVALSTIFLVADI
jgi:hypothetical protein